MNSFFYPFLFPICTKKVTIKFKVIDHIARTIVITKQHYIYSDESEPTMKKFRLRSKRQELNHVNIIIICKILNDYQRFKFNMSYVFLFSLDFSHRE